MNKYNIITPHTSTELFLGMFGPEVEIENQFKKNVKGVDVYLFYIDSEGISDDGITIVCPMDKKTQVVPFNSILKTKDLDTGGILKIDKYAPVDKTIVTTHLISGGDPLTLYDANLLPREYNEINIKAGVVTLTDTEGDTMSADDLYAVVATIELG